MIKAALTININQEDMQQFSYLVNSTPLGLLSSATQNIHIQTSHRPLQYIIGIKADKQDRTDDLASQKTRLYRWQAFIPILAQRGCSELNATLAQYQLQPDLLVCYDQNRMFAWIPLAFGFYLLRDGELRKLRPVSLPDPLFGQTFHEQTAYYTLQIRQGDFFLLLPPDLPSVFATGEIVDLMLGLTQLPAKMSDLMLVARQRGYVGDSSWLAIEVLLKDEDQQPEAPREKNSSNLFSRIIGRNTKDEVPESHESGSDPMSGEEEAPSPEKTVFQLLWADRSQAQRFLLIGFVLIIVIVAGVTLSALVRKTAPIETSAASTTGKTASVTATPAPTPTSLPTATPQPTDPPVSLQVTANRLNLREEPGSDAPLLMTLSSGDRLEQLAEPEEDWVKVKTADGTVGYVYAPYVTILE